MFWSFELFNFNVLISVAYRAIHFYIHGDISLPMYFDFLYFFE